MIAGGHARGRGPAIGIFCGALLLLAGAASGDPLPSKMIFFVPGLDCPEGSAPATDAAGRMLLVVNNSGDVGKTLGDPLTDQEDRSHSHSGKMSVNLSAHSISGANGPNNQATRKGSQTANITSGASTSGLPFIQLLVCQAN
jgi:hypothetical protein